MINDDKEMDMLLGEAMRNVARKRDEKLIDEIAAMDEDEFRRALAISKMQTTKIKPFWWRVVHSPITRVAAAVIVCALVIWGVTFISFPPSTQPAYASMFNAYYHDFKVEQYEAEGNLANPKGYKSTEGMIKEASVLLSKTSHRSTRKAIEKLERLLYKIDDRKKEYDSDAHWYLGLAYLKNGEKQKAVEQFEIVKALNNKHVAEASDLLKKLEKAR